LRVASPDQKAIEIDGITGRRYRSKSGMYDMHPADAAHIADIGGFIPGMNGVTSKSKGYRCTQCGFGTYFTTCSRCGGSAVKE
jgi:hypothetical protein